MLGHVRPVRLRDPRKHAALNSRPDRVRHGAPRGGGGCVSGLSYRRRMVEIAEYEKRGDLAAPFQLSKQAEKKQREAERIREAVRCDLPPLAWEQYIAGEPCPGCGRPYRDAEPWEVRGTMNLTDEERTRYDAEQARFKQAHSECHSHRHSVEGSLTLHCGKCCPAPPLSPEQRETIGKVFSTRTPPPATDEVAVTAVLRARRRGYRPLHAQDASRRVHRQHSLPGVRPRPGDRG